MIKQVWGRWGGTSLFFYKLVISKLFSPKSLEFPLRDLGIDFKYYRLALPIFELLQGKNKAAFAQHNTGCRLGPRRRYFLKVPQLIQCAAGE